MVDIKIKPLVERIRDYLDVMILEDILEYCGLSAEEALEILVREGHLELAENEPL